MSTATDFDAIVTPKTPTTYLGDFWDETARAIKSCKDVGVALDAGTFTISAAGAATFASTLGVTGVTTLSDALNVTGAGDFASTLQVDRDATIGDGAVSSGARALTVNAEINQISELVLQQAGSEFWALQLGTAQEFNLRYLNGDVVLLVEPGANANSLYIDADGNVSVGGDPTATYDFRVQRAGAILAGLTNTSAAGEVQLLMSNTTQSWSITAPMTTGNFKIQDNTGGGAPFFIELGAPTNAFHMDADGHIGFGANPNTSNFVLDNNTDAAVLFDIDGGSTAAQNRDLRFLDRGTEQWAWRAASGGSFQLRDSGSVNVLTVEDGADVDSVYVDSEGHVGVGADPGATYAFNVVKGSAWRFHNQADAAVSFRLGGGSTAEQVVDLLFVDRSDTIQWRLRKEGSNRFGIFDASANAPLLIEQGSPTNSLVLDSTGGLGLNTNAPTSSTAIDINYTTKALLLSRMTTTQRNALTPINGMIIYNSTTAVIEGREAGAWVNL